MKTHHDSETLVVAGLESLVESLRPGLRVHEDSHVSQPGETPVWIGVHEARSSRWFAVLIVDNDVASAARALQAGARAIITLNSTLSELRAAIDTLSGGRSPYLAEAVARALASGVLANKPTPGGLPQVPTPPRLTPRESEVLAHIARGMTNQEIADSMVVSVNTVRSHIQSLGVKLNASNRSRIVANAVAAGLPEAHGVVGPQAAFPSRGRVRSIKPGQPFTALTS